MTFSPGRLRRLIVDRGGFTLHARSGALVHHGIAVGADPTAALCFPSASWHDGAVGTWLAAHRRAVVDRGLHLGGWWDRERDVVHLDVVRVFPAHHRSSALRASREAGQWAAFDLGRGEVVPVEPGGPLPEPRPAPLGLGA